jgi:hypothetical protein
MKKIFIVFFISLSFLSACDIGDSEPGNLIPKKKMALILKDFMLLEATYNTRLIRVENKDELMHTFSDEILANYGVSKKDFDDSYEYYVGNSQDFEEIIELVFEELNKMETKSSNFNDTKVPKDSILISE